jgi:hypothetical protein
VKTAQRLAVLLFLLPLVGCSALVDPWSGTWQAASGQTLRFSADGKLTYSNNGIVYAKGEYSRLGYRFAALRLKSVPMDPPRPEVKNKRVVKLDEAGNTFTFNRVRYRKTR